MTTTPKRGEIWLVDLNPTRGVEIQKIRPVIVLSSDYVGKLPLKLVVPITTWKDYFSSNIWHISLDPTPENGLTRKSAADVFQLRSVDTRRFIRKLGVLPETTLQEMSRAIAILIEYQP
ncbi:MAG: type II toxin-antitoxin system PemK/MazF family toxin [Kamptonema sp. SIO4C4]|nr:type II toxin-antitoxin system PemK/MazF family toxin [Kamptonema sp. SIO4C4]